MAVNVTPQETPPVAGKQTRGRHDTEIGIRMSATHGNTEYKRCRHELSCCFKSVSGFCPDHDRDDLYRRPVVELDNGKVVAVESLMKPSTRRAKR